MLYNSWQLIINILFRCSEFLAEIHVLEETEGRWPSIQINPGTIVLLQGTAGKQPGRLIKHPLHLDITVASLWKYCTHPHRSLHSWQPCSEDHLLPIAASQRIYSHNCCSLGTGQRTHSSGHSWVPLGPPDSLFQEAGIGIPVSELQALDL